MCFVIFDSNVYISCFLPLFILWGGTTTCGNLSSPPLCDAENEVKLSGRIVGCLYQSSYLARSVFCFLISEIQFLTSIV